MAEYNRPNDDPNKTDFAVFPNQYKKSNNHPDHTGNVEISRPFLKTIVTEAKKGKFPILLGIALWNSISKMGDPYMGASLSLSEWDIRKNEEAAVKSDSKPIDEPDDDLPF